MSRYELGQHSNKVMYVMGGDPAQQPAPGVYVELEVPQPTPTAPAPARPSLLDRVLGYFHRLSKNNKIAFMVDTDLLARVKADAADGVTDTPYAREYERRAAFRRAS